MSTTTIDERTGFGNPREAAFFPLAALVAAFATLYYPVVASLVHDWWIDPNYSHGFIIPVLSAYFVWNRRSAIRAITFSPSNGGIALLVAGLAMLVAGDLASELFTMRVSILVVLAGLVLFILGAGHLRLLLFPILFLVLMIPIPAIIFNKVALPLQLMASSVASSTLFSLGIPVLREGNVIMLPSITLEVVEACSGIRSLVSLISIGVILAYFSEMSSWKRVLLVLLAVPIAIVTNVIRVSGTGVLSHYYGEKVAQGFYHTFSGWLVFVSAFAMLGLITLVLKRLPR